MIPQALTQKLLESALADLGYPGPITQNESQLIIRGAQCGIASDNILRDLITERRDGKQAAVFVAEVRKFLLHLDGGLMTEVEFFHQCLSARED